MPMPRPHDRRGARKGRANETEAARVVEDLSGEVEDAIAGRHAIRPFFGRAPVSGRWPPDTWTTG
jgi:hypothetical protein